MTHKLLSKTIVLTSMWLILSRCAFVVSFYQKPHTWILTDPCVHNRRDARIGLHLDR